MLVQRSGRVIDDMIISSFKLGVVMLVLGGWFQCSGWRTSKRVKSVKYRPIFFGASRQLSNFAGVPSYIRVVFSEISRTFAR